MQTLLKMQAYHRGKKVYENTLPLPITIGRTSQNNVVFENPFISRAHCHIFEENGKILIEDLNSSNGVYIFDKKISEKHEITESFDFRLGEIEVHVEVFSPNEEATKVPQHKKSIPPPIKANEIAYAQKAEKPAHDFHQQKTVTKTIGKHIGGKTKSLITKDFSNDLLGFHTDLLQAGKQRKIEAVVMWHDQVYEVREYYPSEVIRVGLEHDANLNLPMPQEWALASVGFDNANCYIPPGRDVTLISDGKRMPMGDLIANQVLKQKEIGYKLTINFKDVVKIDLGSNLHVTLRYVPATKQLTKAKITEPDHAFKQSIIGSFILHGMFALTLLFKAPKVENVPKLDKVPERFARLLVEKPKPKPTPKPTPPPPEKKVVEKKPEPPKKPEKIVKKQPQKVFKQPKALTKVNKFPMVVKNPIPKAPPPVKVENLGALGALGAISKTAQPNVVTNININPNAGGMQTKKINTGGIVGALPSSNGKLVAAGNVGNVKTKGFGYGTGTGYGIQGLKGAAGSRGVVGAVVGEPKLAQISKTEGLTRAQVMAVVQKHLSEVQHCYEKSLLNTPSLAGRMEFEWDISANGQVTDVRVKRSSVSGGDNLGECVKGVFSAMQFPQAKNGATTTPNIGFPFGRL